VAKLILNPTAHSRRDIPLRGELLSIGRDPTNDVVLSDAMVSRRHAVVERLGSRYVLRDCNSSNGSLVNGNLIAERPLRDGDLVAIGAMRLLFRDDPMAADSSGKILRHPSAQRMVCPSCGQPHRAGDAFCRQCGEVVAEVPAGVSLEQCERCGREVVQPARFCSSCGVRLRAGGSEGRPEGVDDMPWATALRQIESSSPSLSVPASLPSAPPGVRLLAALVDAVLVSVAECLLMTPVALYWSTRALPATTEAMGFLPILLSLITAFGALVLAAAYPLLFVGFRGATPGKQLFGLRVVASNGRAPIGAGRSLLRLAGGLASVAALGLGFLPVLLGQEALHDHIAGTRVVRVTGKR